jgi:carbon-monoxide dehydrogenase small subunit
MSACELAARPGPLSDDEIRHALDGNLCRCTGYHNIVAAVKTGLAAMQAAQAQTSPGSAPAPSSSSPQSQTGQAMAQSQSTAPAAV